MRAELAAKGAAALHSTLAKLDAKGAARLRPGDGQRIARALEVVLGTGLPLRRASGAAERPRCSPGLRVERHVVEPPRPVLHERIATRAAAMLQGGAREEVRALMRLDLPPTATVSKAIGVAQIVALERGEHDRAQALALIVAATRQYAKRQSTWFRGQLGPAYACHDVGVGCHNVALLSTSFSFTSLGYRRAPSVFRRSARAGTGPGGGARCGKRAIR